MLGRLIERLGGASKEERRCAAEELVALAKSDAAVVALLRAALADPAPRRRWGAAFALCRAGVRDDPVFAGALEALGDNDGDVRWAAAEICVSLAGADPARRCSILAMAADPAAPGRKMALYCLRDLGINDEGVLEDALKAGETAVRLAAVSCLARIPVLSRRGVDALLAAVDHDADVGVRRAAAVALRGAVDHEGEVRPVLERLRSQSTDPDLVRATERALAALGTARRGT